MLNTVDPNPFDQLKDTLLDLKEKSEGEALSYALEAQLTVFESIFTSNTLISSVDILLQNLKLALEKSTIAEEHELIRLKSAIMINSIVFFSEAYLYYEEKKWHDEGVKLLQQGCNLLADSAVTLIEMVRTVPITRVELAKNMLKTLLSSKEKAGFFDKLIGVFAKSKKTRQEYTSFIHSLIKKIGKYSYLFGSSLLLAELVERYKNDLIKLDCDKLIPPPKEPKESYPPILERTMESSQLILSYGILIALFIITCFLVYSNGFNWVALIFCVLSVIALIIFCYLKGKDISIKKRNNDKLMIFENEKKRRESQYKRKKNEYDNNVANIEKFYEDIIKSLR